MRDPFYKESLSEKERRNLDILEAIRKSSQISKADISRITDINIVTVSNYVNNYAKKKIVLERGLDVSTGGRRPTLVELNPDYGYFIGVDLGLINECKAGGDVYIVALLLDFMAEVVTKIKVGKIIDTPEILGKKLVEVIFELIEKSKIEANKVKGIGLAFAGIVSKDSGIVRNPVRGGGSFNYMPVKALLENEFKIMTDVENDATVAVLGEKWKGLGLDNDAENIIYICSDSGAGMMLRGELYYGSSGVAGELNINSPDAGLTPEQAAKKGCWESYYFKCPVRSRGIDLGISGNAKAILTENKNASPKMIEMAHGKTEDVTFDIIIEAAKDGDSLGLQLLEEGGNYLGAKIAYLVNVLNPDIIILGRGIEKAGDLILDPVRKSVKRWAFEEAFNVLRILPTRLGEDSVALGAAAMCMQKVFTQVQ